MSYNDGVVRRGGNNNNGAKKQRNDDYAAKKKEIIEKQKKNLEMIDFVCSYLDKTLKDQTVDSKITMPMILTQLNNNGINSEDTKSISQLNYILMDLANAQKSQYISGDHVNIRVLYFEERLKSAYKKELHDTIEELLKKYDTLFFWTNVEE